MLSETDKNEIRKIIQEELKPILEKLNQKINTLVVNRLTDKYNTLDQTHALPPIKKK